MAKHIASLTVAATGGIQASTTTRTLAGELVRFGVPGRTSAGALRVRPGALRFPEDIARVKLTREHDRSASRGFCTGLVVTDTGIRASFRVAEGPDGDDALREAADGTRDALSYDIVDATIVGDEVTDGLLIAAGQVGIPAYDDSRIDTIAAAAANPTGRNTMLSPEQAQRLLELQAKIDNGETLAEDEQKEYDALKVLSALQHSAPADAPADGVSASASADKGVHVHVHTNEPKEPAAVQASAVPAVPGGTPAPASNTTAVPRGGALRKMVSDVTAALKGGMDNGGVSVREISAALSDVIHTDHTSNIEPVAWSGELWSGLQYEPVWTDLLTPGDLTYWEGKGWRFLTTPEMQDYAGDKAAIPSGTVTTEDSSYTAARMAVGVDVDRKFYDFPNEAFVNGLFEKIRETWEIKLDAKVKAFILAQAAVGTRTITIGRTSGSAAITATNGTFRASDVGATITGTGIPASTTITAVTNSGSATMSANASATSASASAVVGSQEGSVLKAAARSRQILTNRRVGTPDWIMVNDEDMFSMLDVNEQQVPAFLELWGINPADFRSSPDVPQGTLLAGSRKAAVLRTLPGSPIRVSAQHIANGGVDEAFFGYWAIEEHHDSGIVSVKYKAAA